MEKLSKIIDQYGEKAIEFVIHLIIALVIFFVVKKIVNVFLRFLYNVLEKTSLDEGVNRFLISLLRTIIYVLIILSLAQFVGIEAATITASVTAVIASAGLTIGLALQGSLQNFAGGVLILLLKPFKLGDYIIAQGYEGTVETIDIFYTKLLTIDNQTVVLPNGGLSNTNITNVTREEIRRLDLAIGIEYSENVARVKNILLGIIDSKEKVLKDRDVNVFVSDFLDSSVNIGARMWCKTEDYWTLKWDMLESIKNEFDAAGIVIPFNQLDVNVKQAVEEKLNK